MMQIVYFSQKSQLWTELGSIPGQKLFVAPSPAKADNLRSYLKSDGSFDVVTIAKFTSELLSQLWESDEGRPQVKRKAELLLIFGILKRKYFPELGYEQFIQAYNMFSDLRSFTLNEEALSSVLEEQPEEIRRSLQIFWKLLEVSGYSDEHAAYSQIAEALRSTDENDSLKKVYVFWGFQHLNGQQVDLIKALAIRYRVIIPFPLSLKEKLKRSDWVSWIKEDRTEEMNLPEIEISPKGSWLKMNSREISLRLKNLLTPDSQVVLGVAKLTSEHMDILPTARVGFKIPHNLVETELLELGHLLGQELGYDFKSLDIEASLLRRKAELIKGPHKKSMPFKKLKALQLYEEALLSIKELTDEELEMDPFFLKLLRDVVLLNQPRTSFSPLLDEGELIELKDMSSLEDVDRNKKVILCIDERFEDIQGLGQNYTESIQKHLSALGPLKRNDLDLAFKQWEFENLFAECEVMVMMPPSVLKHNLIWKRLFSNIDMVVIEDVFVHLARKVIDHSRVEKTKYTGGFSASRLQTFVDCPRKFYYNYVEKITPTLALEKDIDPMSSGSIIHKIIEEFHKRKLNDENLPALTAEIFNQHIREHSLSLPPDVYHQRKIIFNHRAMNGLKFLRELEGVMASSIEWRIEEKFQSDENFKLTGIMDCLGISATTIFLLDFKSSKAAASTNTEVEKMESLQLWVYSLAAQKLLPDFDKKKIVIGYVVLDDPSESNLLLSDQDLMARLKENKIGKPKLLSEDFSESLKKAQERVKELAHIIESEALFTPQPRKSGVCDYCELTRVCLKTGKVENHV